MKCRELTSLVTEYLEDRLAEDVRSAFEAHRLECGGCAAHVHNTRQTVGLLQLIHEPEPVSEASHIRALNRFRDILGRAADMVDIPSEVDQYQWNQLISMLESPRRLDVFEKLVGQCGDGVCTCTIEQPGNCPSRFGQELDLDANEVDSHIQALARTRAFNKQLEADTYRCTVDQSIAQLAIQHRPALVAALEAYAA